MILFSPSMVGDDYNDFDEDDGYDYDEHCDGNDEHYDENNTSKTDVAPSVL